MVAGMASFDLFSLVFDLSTEKGVEQEGSQTTVEPPQPKALPPSLFLWKGCPLEGDCSFHPQFNCFTHWQENSSGVAAADCSKQQINKGMH